MRVHRHEERSDTRMLSVAQVTLPAGTLATVVAPGRAIYIGWLVFVSALGLVAVIRIIRRPDEDWPHKNWSRIAWVLTVLYLAVPIGGYPIPIGAIAAVWRTRRRASKPAGPAGLPGLAGPAGPAVPAGSSPIPVAQGSPHRPLPWEAK